MWIGPRSLHCTQPFWRTKTLNSQDTDLSGVDRSCRCCLSELTPSHLISCSFWGTQGFIHSIIAPLIVGLILTILTCLHFLQEPHLILIFQHLLKHLIFVTVLKSSFAFLWPEISILSHQYAWPCYLNLWIVSLLFHFLIFKSFQWSYALRTTKLNIIAKLVFAYNFYLVLLIIILNYLLSLLITLISEPKIHL